VTSGGQPDGERMIDGTSGRDHAPERRAGPPVSMGRVWPLLVVGGLLATVAVASVVGTPGVHRIPVPDTLRTRIAPPSNIPHLSAQPQHTGTGHGLQSVYNYHLAPWARNLVAGLCLAVVVVVVGFLLWRLIVMWLESRSQRRLTAAGATAGMTRRQAVLDAVDAGIAELARADGDARAAVIACWVRLEEVAAAAGTVRAPGDTSSDLVARMLADHQVSAPVLRSLAELYRTARYSPRTVEASMREQARAALGHLRDELARSRSGPLAADPAEPVSAVPSIRPAGPDPSGDVAP
jgi:hypothetical protein